MDSKKQSKLPPGIGSKIVKALKSQTPQYEAQEANSQKEVSHSSHGFQQPVDAHGLETKTHMDFGSQEMYYDETPGPLEATDIPDLESINSYNEIPQYGSFEIPEENTFKGSSEEFSLITEYDQQSYNEEPYDTSDFELNEYDQQSYEPIAYEAQPASGQANFGKPALDDFDYDQQTYEDFDNGYETDEIEEFQQPQLGEPATSGYQPAGHKPVMEELSAPSYDQFESGIDEYEPFEEQSEYTEYATETPYEPNSNDLEEASEYSQNENTQYQYQEEHNYQPLHEVKPIEPREDIQIGYSNEDLQESYQEISYQEDYHDDEPAKVLDLDAVETDFESSYNQQSISHEPQTPTYTPLDLDNYSHPQITEPQETRPPVRPEAPAENYSYQPPVIKGAQKQEDYAETYSYQEPVKEYRPMEERIYQEPQREYYKPQEPEYREPPREYYKPQEPIYREPPREYYKPQEPEYREHPREYYKPQEQAYREPVREPMRDPLRDPYERAYTPEIRRPRQEDILSHRVADLLNPNVETLMKLVSTLPNGVTKQTGAQIIKQTMEAMGISMNEVLTDAQTAQAHMQKHMNDCYDKIEESKRIIRQLDDDIYNYQRKTKELNDLMSLFVYSDNDVRRR